ncbi:hypothetical protein BGX34_011101, partial [Mortierella sp. NVP85]
MAGHVSGERYLQELCLHSPVGHPSNRETLAIPARWDASTGCHIVLLSDAQLVFKDALRFMDNGNEVPFINGDDLQELVPQRIKYHPKVIIQVLVANAGDGLDGNARSSATFVSDSISHGNLAESLSRFRQVVEEPTITDSVVESLTVPDTASILAYIRHYESSIDTALLKQAAEGPRVQDIFKLLMEYTRQETCEDSDQLLPMDELAQGLILRIQEGGGTQSLEQEMEQKMLMEQEQIIHLRQQGIDRLVSVQEHVQNATALVFAALVRPVPRMFVVLPCISPSQHGPQYPVPKSSDFRLFFLCECNHQPTNEGREASNIHLARHEGYELQDVKEFFQSYTPYLLSMIHILMNGITAPGFNIPSLSHKTLAEGVNEVQDVLDLENNTIQSLMDDMVSHFRGNEYETPMNRMDSNAALDILEAADLYPVVEHLKGHRNQLGHTLGNLRQIITQDGDVKWVCVDHSVISYAHKNDQASSIKQGLHRAFQDMQAKLEKCYRDHQENMKFDKDPMLVQEKIKSLQEEGLTLIGEIQVMASKILLQTLELHEYTVPRLFIVLPKPIGKWDKFATPFRHQFRLFFLCEGCGCIDSDHPDEIHLAIHPGYDL